MSAPGFLDSITPWASRSNTPKPAQNKVGDSSPQTGLSNQYGADHAISRRHRLSLRDYPDDCPKPVVKWFYAVDFPKRKPLPLDKTPQDSKPPPAPKKYVAFSSQDSRSIESAFQTLAESEANSDLRNSPATDTDISVQNQPDSLSGVESKQNTSINDATDTEKGGSTKVPVNEDFLFDVDVQNRELAPAYWLGPIYDVRRGSWFYQEGSSLRPCDENLAGQLEEGYLKVKPWRYDSSLIPESGSKLRPRPTSIVPGQGSGSEENVKDPKNVQTPVSDNVKSKNTNDNDKQDPLSEKFKLQTQRLFGSYMNSVVTYQDATIAWLLTDDFLSRMSSTVYQRFAGGGHLGGVKVVRGFSETTKPKEKKKEGDANPSTTAVGAEASVDTSKRKSITPDSKVGRAATDTQQMQKDSSEQESQPETKSDRRLLRLERQMSSLVLSPGVEDAAKQDEELRKRDEDEIQNYQEADGDEQGREIEHLLLVTHGIGQRLGLRVESVNFIHDVNTLRKTLKGVYETSPDLQALNSEVDKLPKNCRIQVLPVVWRHLLDFPKQSFQENRKEQDLADLGESGDEESYPTLDDITVEGVPAIRNLITDLALDILLYQSAYREHIAGIVQRECNRIYELFVQRNPSFQGKVSMVGHSLGSAILFDILCHQKEHNRHLSSSSQQRRSRSRANSAVKEGNAQDLGLKFEVEDFYCLGSPLGLYQMLKGRKIAGRKMLHGEPAESPLDPSATDDPFLGASLNPSTSSAAVKESDILSVTFSSPKCKQLFNIFHPADPISYRIEPLISPAMSALKPQLLPYIKKGIFGAPGQGFTAIGTRVGQSVSGLWSNITSGVASSLLNRSLGLTGDGQISSSQSIAAPQIRNRTASAGAGTNIIGGVVITSTSTEKDGKRQLAGDMPDDQQVGENPPTMIDSGIETLYDGFQKRQKTREKDEGKDHDESADWGQVNKARRLKREEEKVRALNSNGRVDYSIQESMFDISLLASIASHLSYWADEDVSHFMISQLLARQRVIQR